jgi:hypothetical protein
MSAKLSCQIEINIRVLSPELYVTAQVSRALRMVCLLTSGLYRKLQHVIINKRVEVARSPQYLPPSLLTHLPTFHHIISVVLPPSQESHRLLWSGIAGMVQRPEI